MEFTAGDQISVYSAVKRIAFDATVLKMTDSTVVLTAGEDPPCDVGNVLNLEAPGGFRAMAILSSVVLGQCPLLNLVGLSWVGARPRADRVPRVYQVNVDLLAVDDPRRTVGQTINLSVTGVRVRLRNAMAIGTLARLLIHVGKDAPLEVVGRVARIVRGSEVEDRGFDVGFSFERWIHSKRTLLEILGLPPEMSTTEPGQQEGIGYPAAS